MPAKGSDDLFRLIKSMSPAEKGYFKKFADRYSFSEKDNNYMKLFDLIDSQENYDEKKLAKESFVNQLPRQKNYLLGLILQSLQVYYAEMNDVVEIENYIQQIRILLQRGQFELCRKLIQKAKKMAEKESHFIELLKLVKFEGHLNKVSGLDRSYEMEKHTYTERRRIMAEETNFTDVQEFEQQVIMFTRDEYSNKKLLTNKLLTDQSPPLLSPTAKGTFYNALSVYYNCIRDYEKQYFYSRKYMEYNREHFKVTGKTTEFLTRFINPFFACYANKKYKECSEIVSEIMKTPLKTKQEETLRNGIIIFIKLNLYIGTGKFEQALPFLKTYFEDNKPEGFFMNLKLDKEIIRNVILIYFANKKYKESLKLVNVLMSPETKEHASYIYYQALLLNILIHYELENKETTEHLIIAAKRNLKNNEKLTAFEEIFLTFFKKYVVAESKALLGETIGKLKEISQQENYHSHASIYSFCLSWLESKLKSKSLPETVKEKAKKEAGKDYWD